ncbi:MAG TPA: MFS transporter, partial [Roseiflexaceae bacterium]
GTATSTLQFSRSIGGTLGVSVMGAALSVRLAAGLAAAGLNPATISVNELLDPLARAGASMTIEGALRDALANAIQGVFVIAFIAAALGLAVTFLAPAGRIAQLAAQQNQGMTESAGQSVTPEG